MRQTTKTISYETTRSLLWDSTNPSGRRGRYGSKWEAWGSTIEQMEIDEELLNMDAGLTTAFKEVDIASIQKCSFELLIK